MNHLWVAEATENSIYFLNFDTPNCSHLKNAAASAQSWAKTCSLVCICDFHISWLLHSHVVCCLINFLSTFLQTIDQLREKVLFIIGNGKC